MGDTPKIASARRAARRAEGAEVVDKKDYTSVTRSLKHRMALRHIWTPRARIGNRRRSWQFWY